MFDWDDVRIFTAAARAGSLAAAGTRLGLDAATVGRRISRLEAALKATLLTRSPQGLSLTSTGAQLLAQALEAESAMDAIQALTRGDIISGAVRISAAEGFGGVILAPALPALRRTRPGLTIELAASTGFLSASRREVDIAITLAAPNPERLTVEPLTDYQLALYAAPDYLAARRRPETVADLEGHDIVGYVADLIYAPELRYLDEVMPGLTAQVSSTSIRAQREIIAAGGGIGILPCFLAQGLERVLADDILLRRRFWLSAHRDMHDTARMRVVRAWISDLCAQNAERLSPY